LQTSVLASQEAEKWTEEDALTYESIIKFDQDQIDSMRHFMRESSRLLDKVEKMINCDVSDWKHFSRTCVEIKRCWEEKQTTGVEEEPRPAKKSRVSLKKSKYESHSQELDD